MSPSLPPPKSPLIQIVDRYVSRLKGSSYELDPRIGPRYLGSVVGGRLLMLVRGRLRFPLRPHSPFVGTGARLRATDKLRFGSGVTFGTGTYVDAMSTDGIVLGDNTSVGRNTRIECSGCSAISVSA